MSSLQLCNIDGCTNSKLYSLAVQVIFRLPSAPDSDGIRDSSIYQVCAVLCVY
jgi:hypothetical protein